MSAERSSARPATRKEKNALEDDRLDSPEGKGGRSRLGGDGSRDGGDDDGTGLGLPVSVDDGALASSDLLLVPVPGLGVDGLSDRSDDPQALEAVASDVLLTESSEESDGGRSGVEVGDLVLVDDVPVSRGSGVDGRRLKDGGRDSVEEGSVDDVGVT